MAVVPVPVPMAAVPTVWREDVDEVELEFTLQHQTEPDEVEVITEGTNLRVLCQGRELLAGDLNGPVTQGNFVIANQQELTVTLTKVDYSGVKRVVVGRSSR